MIGSHPTTQRIHPLRALAMLPAMGVLLVGVLLAVAVNYVTETVRDYR